MGFSRQEYWSGLPFPSPGDLPNPGIEPQKIKVKSPPGDLFISADAFQRNVDKNQNFGFVVLVYLRPC